MQLGVLWGADGDSVGVELVVRLGADSGVLGGTGAAVGVWRSTVVGRSWCWTSQLKPTYVENLHTVD